MSKYKIRFHFDDGTSHAMDADEVGMILFRQLTDMHRTNAPYVQKGLEAEEAMRMSRAIQKQTYNVIEEQKRKICQKYIDQVEENPEWKILSLTDKRKKAAEYATAKHGRGYSLKTFERLKIEPN